MMNNFTNATNNTLTSKSHQLTTLSIVRITVYAVSLFLGLVGNCVVIITSIFQRKSLSRSRFLIAHLAVTDVLFSLGIPVRINLELNGEKWEHGLAFCKLFHGFNSMLMLASIGTMMVIAIERYRGTARPYLTKIRRSTIMKSLALVWLVSVLTYIPILTFREVKNGKCKEDHSDIGMIRVYSVVLVIVKYVIPLTVIGCCYMKIASTVKNRPRIRCLIRQQKRRERDDNRIITILIVMVIAFAVLTLPSSIWWLLVDFGRFKASDAPMQIVEVFAIFVYFHSWVNPIALLIMDSKFRSDIRQTIKCRNALKGSSRSGTANEKGQALHKPLELVS